VTIANMQDISRDLQVTGAPGSAGVEHATASFLVVE